MNEIMCSKGYREFSTIVSADNATTAEALLLVEKGLPNIASELHLGKLELRVEMNPSKDEPDGLNVSKILFTHPEGFNYKNHTRIINNHERGKAIFVASPEPEYVWNQEETEAIDFLFRYINLVISRARMTDLYTRKQMTDYMTVLPNTACFMKFANELLTLGTLNGYSVIFTNIRNFNFINQQLGGKVGDEVLKEYSAKLLSFYGKDEIIARFGGDNFVALIKDENVNTFLRNISSITVTVIAANTTRRLTFSSRAGIYSIPGSMNINDAVARANACLSYAKRTNEQDYVWFESDILDTITEQREIVTSFNNAIVQREFVVYFQPKVNLDTMIITGCEALVRWQKGDKLLAPFKFIPILEESGLICDLDFYILDRCCRIIRSWINSGIIPPRVSVNFSKLHLKNQTLASDILAIIDKYNIPPEYIEIELTETSAYGDFESLYKFITELGNYGIFTSLDDFGTGYSSLNMLKDLPLNVIKIDKSFIDNITDEQSKNRLIVKAMLTLIEQLDKEVIAEGVETTEQAKILKDMNCKMIQGYLFDKPMPSDQFTARIRDNKPYDIEL